jgi:hypothetical protein
MAARWFNAWGRGMEDGFAVAYVLRKQHGNEMNVATSPVTDNLSLHV